MSTIAPERHVTEIIDGYIAPERWYCEEGMLKAVGIGRKQLTEARLNGHLRSKEVGRRLLYSGAEIIRYIESCPDRK